MPVALSSRANPSTPTPPAVCGLKRQGRSNMLGVRGVQGYTHDGKCDGTYSEIRDGAHVPSGDILVERGPFKHALQQHTRCMSIGALAEWACEHMPAAPSSRAKPQHPHASLGGIYANSKGGGNQICWGYEVCAGGYTHMTASAMARTDIYWTELVFQLEMLPLNEVAPQNMPCSNTHGA